MQTLIAVLVLCMITHYCFSDGRLIWKNSGSLLRIDRTLDLAFLVLPVFLIGLLIIGFRPLDAGFDTPNYISAWLKLDGFNSARQDGADVYGNTEYLWWPLQSLFIKLLSARGWLVLNYALVFFSVFWVYHKICRHFFVNPLIFPFVFLTYYFVYSGNAMRQALALPFGLLAFCWWFEKRYVYSLLAICFSIGLHWSSLIFILTPVITLPIFRKKSTLITLPILMLATSFMIDDVSRVLVQIINMPELTVKHQLYFEGGRASHVGSIWTKFNFWLCFGVSFLFLATCPPSRYSSNVLHSYVLLFLSLMLFGVTVADISERFFPALLLVTPLMVILIIQRFKIPPTILELTIKFFFLALWILICSTESAQQTLGFTL
ncbi:EpsG family protein [Halomonas casei]|uniref:EpsG family protein n=1 Tax=Halomonas casei TaxID=2742613 RepID=UPI003CE954B5